MIGRFRDPPRLTDDPLLSAEGLGALIEQVRGGGPDRQKTAALFARLEPHLAEVQATPALPDAAARPYAAAGASAGNLSAVMKVAAAAGVASAIAAALLWSAQPRRPTAVRDPVTAADHPAATIPAPPLPPAAGLATGPVRSAAAAPPRESGRPATARASNQGRPPSVAAPRPTPESEADLLRAAMEALVTEPRAVLSITNEHARRYPRGNLAQEREVIAIDALVRIGETAAARLRAERFLAANPRTAHHARIDSLLKAAPVGRSRRH